MKNIDITNKNNKINKTINIIINVIDYNLSVPKKESPCINEEIKSSNGTLSHFSPFPYRSPSDPEVVLVFSRVGCYCFI